MDLEKVMDIIDQSVQTHVARIKIQLGEQFKKEMSALVDEVDRFVTERLKVELDEFREDFEKWKKAADEV